MLDKQLNIQNICPIQIFAHRRLGQCRGGPYSQARSINDALLESLPKDAVQGLP